MDRNHQKVSVSDPRNSIFNQQIFTKYSRIIIINALITNIIWVIANLFLLIPPEMRLTFFHFEFSIITIPVSFAVGIVNKCVIGRTVTWTGIDATNYIFLTVVIEWKPSSPLSSVVNSGVNGGKPIHQGLVPPMCFLIMVPYLIYLFICK